MLLYHYTKIDASINIIRNGLCFWGFRYDSMNDPTDYIFARDIILPKLLQKQPKEDRSDYLTIYPYIVSFCTERDFEMMWRLYQGEVALVIDSEKLPFEEWGKERDISEDTLYNKVMYATEESIESVAKELYENRREILNYRYCHSLSTKLMKLSMNFGWQKSITIHLPRSTIRINPTNVIFMKVNYLRISNA